jgi:hypothetical protein
MPGMYRLITVEPTPGASSERRHKMGNTVGSLSEVQHAIVVGTLLGDGSMRCRANALLEINHSYHQSGYVGWKYSHLADLVATPPKRRLGNGERIAYRFVTRSLPVLTPYFHLFLRNWQEASTRSGTFSTGAGSVVYGRWLQIAKRGVSEHSAVRLAEPACATWTPANAVRSRRHVEPRQVLSPDTYLGERDEAAGEDDRAISPT